MELLFNISYNLKHDENYILKFLNRSTNLHLKFGKNNNKIFNDIIKRKSKNLALSKKCDFYHLYKINKLLLDEYDAMFYKNKELYIIKENINDDSGITDILVDIFEHIKYIKKDINSSLIYNLKNLKSLDISYCKFKINKKINKMNNLFSISLTDNKIKVIPEYIYDLKLLQLIIKQNNIINISDVESKDSRTDNKLSDIEYKDSRTDNNLSKKIGDCTTLVSLAIMGKKENLNKLIVPKEIGNLINLRSLGLSYNNIKVLPREIIFLKNLEELWIDNNQIEVLPDEIYELTNLQELNMGFNKIKIISKSINKLIKLMYLEITSYDKIEIPEEINELNQLVSVYLYEEQFNFISELIKNNKKNIFSFSSKQIN